MTSRRREPPVPADDNGTSRDRHDGESDTAKFFRRARWTLAFAISAVVLGFVAYWLATGTRPSCQVITVAPTSTHGAKAPETGTTTTTCGLPNVSDFIYVLAVVGLLLLPEAKSLSFGGLGFERLTNQVEQQTREIGQLRQQVSTTINIGADRGMLDDLRSGVRDMKARLEQSRSALPSDTQTRSLLADFDTIAERTDSASATELVTAAATGHRLLEEARRAAEAQLRRSTAVTDADVAEAVEAEDVVRDILGTASASEAPAASLPEQRKVEE